MPRFIGRFRVHDLNCGCHSTIVGKVSDGKEERFEASMQADEDPDSSSAALSETSSTQSATAQFVAASNKRWGIGQPDPAVKGAEEMSLIQRFKAASDKRWGIGR